MGSHYFDANPTVPMEMGEVELVVDGRRLTLITARGVFGAQRLDLGTNVLIQHAPRPPDQGDILDLGCGYGPIAVALALRAPHARVWAVDVNQRALGLAAANAANVGATNVTTAEPDAVPDEVRYSAIYSNPPIKVGKESLHDLLARWLPRLATGANAYLVVKKSMGSDTLERWLNERGWPTQRLRSKSGYRILDVCARPVDQDPTEAEVALAMRREQFSWELRLWLITQAARRRWVVHHDELAAELAPLVDLEPDRVGDLLHEALAAVAAYESQAGRPMLTSLVVSSVTHAPTDGYFDCARSLGHEIADTPAARQDFWQRQCQLVYERWRTD